MFCLFLARMIRRDGCDSIVTMNKQLKVLVVGCGRMGTSHAHAYQQLDQFKVVCLVSRNPQTREALSQQLGGVSTHHDFYSAVQETKPDVVSINSYTETHAQYAIYAMQNGAHVFLEKPLAANMIDAQAVTDAASKYQRKLVIGYILRHHPSWQQFVQVARELGKPLVMRMNLNQQLSGDDWDKHKKLLHATSPIVDCGVHYIDIMCQMTQANPVRVHAIGARLTPEIHEQQYNFGQLQVVFDDESIGWYECAWGPMISENAFFIKDVIGPKGCASIHDAQAGGAMSSDIHAHTRTKHILHHTSALNERGEFAQQKNIIQLDNEPDHVALCLAEQQFLLDAIEHNVDLSAHHRDALNSLNVVLAADLSVCEQRVVSL